MRQNAFLKNQTVRTVLLRLLLSAIFSVLALYGYQINEHDSVEYFRHPVLFIVLVVAFYCVILLIDAVLSILERSKGFVLTDRFLTGCGLFILAVWIFVWLALFPGLAIYDGPSQLAQFQNGTISTHHPYIHTMFLGLCDKCAQVFHFSDYSFYNALVQILFQWICYMRLLFVMRKMGVRSAYLLYTVFFMAFYPANIFLALTTTKDIFFLGFFLLLMCEMAQLYGEQEERERRNCFIRMAVFAGLMSWFRNNAIYAFAAGFPFILCVSPKKLFTKAALVFLAVFAMYFAYSGFVSGILKIPSGDGREAMSAIIQPVSRIYNSVPGELSDDELSRIRQMFGGEVNIDYVSYCSDYSKFDFDTGFFLREWKENLRLYFDLFKRYPTAYLDAWFATNLGNYYPLEGLPRKYKVYYEIPLTDQGHSLFPAVYERIADFAWNSSYRSSRLLTIWLNSGTTQWKLLYLLYFIVRRRDYRKLGLCALPCMMMGTLLLAAGTVIRYTQPMTLCVPLLLTVAMWAETQSDPAVPVQTGERNEGT